MFRIVSIVLFAIFPSLSWASQEEAQVWLDKMTYAVQSLNYEGTFVFMHGKRMDTMQIVHGYDKSGVKERLTSLTGEAREVIRDQDILRCVWPGSKYVVVGESKNRHGLPTVIPSSFDRLSEYYDFHVTGRDRVAGMDCVNISIRPKDAYRYGYELCIAERNNMLLKSAMLNTKNKAMERMMFTSLSFHDSIPAERFSPTMQAEDYTWHSAATQNNSFKEAPDPHWQIRKLPPGFYQTENQKRLIAMEPKPVQHMVFTDGFASVSVFIAELGSHVSDLHGLARRGSINAYARDIGNHRVTVMGEVPKSTVEMFGESISYLSED